MVSPESVNKQLKKLKFNPHGWGRSEVAELPHILVPDEEIYELANGYYEGGFGLLVGTNIRVLLVDKKPLNYLTVEDLRFDMINEIDYSHRLFGAFITISTGSKELHFTSYNQKRLRKLINHVQDCMAQIKLKQSEHQEGQVSHLEKINDQLQNYLLAQQQYQQQLQDQLQQAQSGQDAHGAQPPEPAKPDTELSDYLYAQGLLNEYWKQQEAEKPGSTRVAREAFQAAAQPSIPAYPTPQADDLKDAALKEIMSHRQAVSSARHGDDAFSNHFPGEINPLSVAYSKLPMALRNRRFGKPSFHAHSQSN
jgi:hypothetical protein